MSTTVEDLLVKHLSDAHAMEKQALQLLKHASGMVPDEEIARIYSAHELQTQEHERYIAERLEAHGENPSALKDVAMQAGALGLATVAQASADTPIRLATAAFAFENLEIATYRTIERLADRAGDTDTRAVAERILEQEEIAAELLAGALDRSLEITLGEAGRSPLPPLTPIASHAERTSAHGAHQGPQSYKDMPADEPVAQPPDISSPTEELREELTSPEPGYPAANVDPYGGSIPPADHPERIGDTAPDQQGA